MHFSKHLVLEFGGYDYELTLHVITSIALALIIMTCRPLKIWLQEPVCNPKYDTGHHLWANSAKCYNISRAVHGPDNLLWAPPWAPPWAEKSPCAVKC